MRTLRNFLFLVLTVSTLFSCEKYQPTFHKIKYEITLIEGADPVGSPILNDVTCKPFYKEDGEPVFPTIVEQVPYTWDYEYWQLVDGEPVSFSFSPTADYMFKMSIYIDDVLVSWKIVDTDNSGNYYAYQGVDQGGLDESGKPDYPVIKFTYKE